MVYVVNWISFNEAMSNYDEIIFDHSKVSVYGKRWEDYIRDRNEDEIKYLEALRKSIIENNIRYTGMDHQYLNNGVPLFNDGRVATFSFRAWGRLIASIWNTEENTNYEYTDFYM